MSFNPSKTVREFAIEIPNATRVFEKMKIDYCCGGNRPLNEACSQAGLQVEEVMQLLGEAELTEAVSDRIDIQSQPLAQLANYIVNTHHIFTREELERLTALLEKVCSVHEMNHPELLEIKSEFQILRAELEPHMQKEERILFPYIARLESAISENGPAPFAPFGTVGNPIAALMREHDAAGEILKSIRKLSGNFAVPENACFSYRTLYNALEALEADLHRHIHLENNILFPRALQMENKVQSVTV
jgi:regulator of cell morphogenesis and NO signaling